VGFAYDRSLRAHVQFPCLRRARVAEEVDSGGVVGNSYFSRLWKGCPSERSRWRGGRCRVGEVGSCDFSLSEGQLEALLFAQHDGRIDLHRTSRRQDARRQRNHSKYDCDTSDHQRIERANPINLGCNHSPQRHRPGNSQNQFVAMTAA
jgi:hypothetical protein